MPNPRPEMAMGPNVSPNKSAASTATVSGCESIITCPISHIKTQQYPCQYSQLILWSFYSCTATIALSLTHTLIQSLSLSLSLFQYIDGDTAKRTNTAKASTCLAKPFCQESLHKGSRPYCMSAKIYHHCLQTLNNHHHQCKQNLNNVWKIYKYILGNKWDLAATRPIFEQIRHWCHIAVVWLKDNSWKQPNAGKGVLVKTWKHDASINPKSAMASHADVPTGIFLPLELKTMINTKVREQLRSSNTIGLP
jgi:hypothetical protein